MAGVNEQTELDWRYLSTTEAYTSEYTSASEEEHNPDQLQQAITIDTASGPHRHGSYQSQRRGATRPRLIPSQPSVAGTSSPAIISDLLSLSQDRADDSTDTIKSIRARALDKINGNKESSSNISSNYKNTSGNVPSISLIKKGADTAGTSPYKQGLAHSPVRAQTGQDGSSGQGYSATSSSKMKRRSFGPTVDQAFTPRTNTRTSQPEPHHAVPFTLQSQPRKRHSGGFKSQHPVFSTSEDEPEGSPYQDRGRYANEGSTIMHSELKALKARVQELEMECLSRSLSGLSAQDSDIVAPRQLGRMREDQQSPHHAERLQHIIHKHRGSSTSCESPTTPESPAQAKASLWPTAGVRGSALSTDASGRLEISTGTIHTATASMTAAQQPSTQHVALLQEAFKTFEKALSHGGPGMSSSVHSMNKVVLNTISINQTLRTLIKADVDLIDSPSMKALQRASDEQIRSLTESLLATAKTDRNPAPSDMAHGDMTTCQPYTGQLPPLGTEATEMRDRAEPDSHHLTSRPMSSMASSQLESGSVTPNAMSSSGHLTRTNSIASSTATRVAGRHGYMSDFSQDRRVSYGCPGTDARYRQSSLESSPPQESVQELFKRRQMLVTALKNTNAMMDPPQTLLMSPQFQETPTTAEATLEGIPAHIARRQASVRNIKARYSHLNLRTPTQEQSGQEQDSFTGRLDSPGLDHVRGRLSQHTALSRTTSYGVRQQQLVEGEASHQSSQQPQPLDDPTTASIEFSSRGHVQVSSINNRRPLSQQDHRSYSSLRHAASPVIRQGVAVQRSGRYHHDKVFSDDECSGWGTMGLDQHPQQPNSTRAFAERLQTFRGRNQEQRQSLQQQLEQQWHFGQDDNENQRQYQQPIQETRFYSAAAAAAVAAIDGDMGIDTPVPHFAQRRPQPVQSLTRPHQQQQQQHQTTLDSHYQKYPVQRTSSQRHQDMQMTTPTIPSPNSSPSSSARLDGPSLVSSVGHQGGLVASAGSSMDGRYRLSPRGNLA
ncbi:hypothetical protein BGX28_009980 [Mortierella sp. GBA30]|nr:hypothetical protein BGX28_009980 [Mortierella sp. GBA30]